MFDEWIGNNRADLSARIPYSSGVRREFLMFPSSWRHGLPFTVTHSPFSFPFVHQPVRCSRRQRCLHSSWLHPRLSVTFPSSFCAFVFEIRSGLPRHDVDARYSGHRVTSSSGCSEINSSGKVLLVVWPLSLVCLFLTSIYHCLPRWPVAIPAQCDDYCVTDKHQSRKLVDQFKFVRHCWSHGE